MFSRFLCAALFFVFAASMRAEELPRGLDFPGSDIRKLTLGEAIEMVLQNNLEVQFDKVGLAVQHAQTRYATGIFDPVFRLEVQRQSLQRPDITSNLTSAESLLQQAQLQAIEENTRAIQIATGQPVTPFFTTPLGTTVIFDQDVDSYESSLTFRTPLGTQIAATAREQKIRSTFDGDTRTITPFYQAFGGFEVRQPLLKDFGPDANLMEIRVARIQERVAAMNWEKGLNDAIAAVLVNYFDMIFAQADLRLRQDAIAADTKLVQQNQRRLELGFMSPIDVQQARAQVSLDQEQLLLAKNFFMERQLTLRRLITGDERQTGAMLVFLPVQTPHLDAPEVNRESLLTTAFGKRQDYLAAVTDAERQRVRLRFAKNQAWPNLDLIGTFGYNGLGTGWDDARDRAASSQAPQWSFGVQFSMPLGRVQGRAQLDAIKGLQQQAILKIKQSEKTVTVDVDTAISRIETNSQRLVTARNTRELNEEAVRIAYRRLEEGQLSSFDLIEQQRKLYDARSRELSARADLNRAVIALWTATGTVLENTGVNVTRGKKSSDLPNATKTGNFPQKARQPASR